MFLIYQLIKLLNSTNKYLNNFTESAVDSFFEFLAEMEPEFNHELFYPDVPDHHLVFIEHRGRNFVGKVIDYECDEFLKAKICFLTEDYGIPAVILTKDNTKNIIGNIKEFVACNSEELLEIAQHSKSRSIITLINIFKILKQQNKILDHENIKNAYRNYKYSILLLQYTW